MIRNASMTVCDIPKMDCFDSMTNFAYEDYNHLYESDGVCDCLDDCNSISYDFEMVNLKLNENFDSK